jgi:hypothetical protein
MPVARRSIKIAQHTFRRPQFFDLSISRPNEFRFRGSHVGIDTDCPCGRDVLQKKRDIRTNLRTRVAPMFRIFESSGNAF